MNALITREQGEPRGSVRAWADLVCERFIRLSLSNVELAGDDQIINSECGGVHIGRVRSGPQRVIRTQLDVRKGGEEYVFLNLQIRGTCKAEQNGRQVVLSPGDVSLFDSVSPYTLNFDNAFEQLVVHMPRAWLTRFEGDIGRMTTWGIKSTSSIGGLLANGMNTLERALSDLNDEAACAIANANLLISLAALTAHRGGATQASRQHAHNRALAVIECFCCDRRLTPGRVATLVGCSLRYLQGIFADRLSTIDGAIWESRLRLASEVLVRDPQRPITKVALDCGFVSASHFSSSFREHFNASPTEWRRRDSMRGSINFP